MATDIRHPTMTLLFCLLTGLPAGGVDIYPSGPLSLSQWTEPVPLTEVNSDTAEDWSPHLSSDGLTLYFARVRSESFYYGRIFEAVRTEPSGPFSVVREVDGPLNAATGHVLVPWVSPDGLRMYCCHQVDAAFMLEVSERPSCDAPWPQGTPIEELNRLCSRIPSARLTPDELTIFFDPQGMPGGRGGYDLWTASRPDRETPFANVKNLEHCNTEWNEGCPCVSSDGLTLLFHSDRTGHFQLFAATRETVDDPFAAPEPLAALDAPGYESAHPSLTADGSTLYFARQHTGDRTTLDIWVAQRRVAYYVDGEQGNDTNDGLTPQTAFATIQRGIDAATDGDAVLVAPGVYREDIASKGKAITVQSLGDAAIIEAPHRFAVSFYMGEGPDMVLRNFIVANSYVGIFCAHSAPTITNVTVTGNVHGVEAYGRAVPQIRNSIFWGNIDSDLYGCQAAYSCIERSSHGLGNFSGDPLFVDAENGDYHVRSERGRYWPLYDIWVLDDVSSPCIDVGDPAADFSRERRPNGGRLNVGAHGGTPYAAMSECPFSTDVNGDGVVDTADLELFTGLWEQEAQSQEPPKVPRRR